MSLVDPVARLLHPLGFMEEKATAGVGTQDSGFWTRFWSRLRFRPQLEPGGEQALPAGETFTESGETIAPGDAALRIAAAWACVGLRSDTIASLPLHVKNADKTLALAHPLYNLLHLEPNADMTSFEFFACIVACLDLWGNSYALIDRSADGRVIALTPKNPAFMRVRRLQNGALRYTYHTGRSEPIEYDEQRVLHFRGLTLDGIVGLSPIEYAAEMMGDVLGANRAASREFRNGLKVGGFIKTPQGVELTPAQRLLFQDNLQRYSSNPDYMGKWFLLEYGFEPASGDSIRMSPRVAQLLETRYFGIEEVCRALRVPPQLIGHTDKASSWASSLANLNQAFLTYSIYPTLVRLEQRMRRQLLQAAERPDYSVRFNFAALLRGNFSEQTSAYATALQNGWRNADEIREFEDEPPLPDGQGQVYRVPMNQQAATGATAPAPPAPPAPAGQPRQQ